MNIPLHERIMTRHNNLNFIRFVAALLVIMSHSFSVTEGAYAQGTPLDVITQTRLSFGGVAVAFFFFYSGLLIAKSCETHKRLPDFFNKRIVRIFSRAHRMCARVGMWHWLGCYNAFSIGVPYKSAKLSVSFEHDYDTGAYATWGFCGQSLSVRGERESMDNSRRIYLLRGLFRAL